MTTDIVKKKVGDGKGIVVGGNCVKDMVDLTYQVGLEITDDITAVTTVNEARRGTSTKTLPWMMWATVQF